MEGKLTLEEIALLPCTELACRGISEDAAKFFGVRTSFDAETGEADAFFFPLYRGKELVGYQKKLARPPGGRQRRDTVRVGETKGALPFGAHRAGSGGKMVVVVEGAEDALAAYQMLAAKGKKYRVVSMLGTDGWEQNLEWFSGFEKVLIAYDADAPGREAAAKFASALSAGQGVVAELPEGQDPNSLLLVEGGEDIFLDAIFKAKPHKPDCIIWGEEVWRRMEHYVRPASIPYPPEWKIINHKLEGMREAEISLWCGGTSVGKTSYLRRLKHHVITATPWKVGEVELEEAGEKTWRGLMQFELGKPWAEATKEERREAWAATYGSGRIFTLDHRSQYGRGQSLMGKLKHLHYGHGCNVIFLDHITLAVNHFGDGSGLSAQDRMMSEFLEFVETTKCHLVLISHLRKTGDGVSFEEGGVPAEDDLKGSGSLKQITFDTIAVSRNKMHPDPYEQNVSQMHVLKCRETGRTGAADRMFWDDASKQLVPVVKEF